jgi:ABC-type Zn uptake system ZnuABC Zn-binding protein ZnuA
VQQVGGDRIDLQVLVGPEGDAHTFEPTPKDSVKLSDAKLIFENGLGFEVWLDDLCQASRTQGRRCNVSRDLKPIVIDGNNGKQEIDPHVWQSPIHAIRMVKVIAAELSEIEPASAAYFEKRAEEYIAQLTALDAEIKKEVGQLDAKRRVLVTTHDTFGYFAAEYGFQVFSVLGSVSSESSDPSAGEIVKVVDRIRSFQVPAVFTENILNPKLTEQIAVEAGVTVVPSLYTDALGPTGSPGETYLGMMRFNLHAIVGALRS